MATSIKEIIIKSHPGYFSNPIYEDKLRITENGLFYKKTNIFDKNEGEHLEDVTWSYKSNSKEYKKLFSKLDKLFKEYEYIPQGHFLDAGCFTISIKYFDGKKDSYFFFNVGEYIDKKIITALKIISKMVPDSEDPMSYLFK